MSERLDRASKIAEIVGASAVVLGLAFVGLEIRENTEAQRLTATQGFLSDYVQALDSLADRDSMCMWLQGMNDFFSLSEVDQARWSTRMLQIWRPFEQMYYAALEDEVDTRIFSSMEGMLMSQASLNGFRDFWESRRDFYSAGFQDYIDDVISRSLQRPAQPYDLSGCDTGP